MYGGEFTTPFKEVQSRVQSILGYKLKWEMSYPFTIYYLLFFAVTINNDFNFIS